MTDSSSVYLYLPQFLSQAEADRLYQHSRSLTWMQNDIRMFGKFMPVPRQEAIYGDEGCNYFYSSSVLLEPLPWTDELAKLRQHIQIETGFNFNITIGNRYPSGNHSIGWHSDNEKSMGQYPAIASISLGSIRKFSLKPRKGNAGEGTHFYLEHGSLLLMLPGCQSTHVHQLPKTKQIVGDRINWTFRPHLGGIAP
jgi:alkylated DNA repair dioxygenase AlkB